MKLIKRTYYYTGIWLLPIMVIGSVFCFYMIEYIAYEETDEFLTYEMDRLISYHEEFNDLPQYPKVANILPGVSYAKPIFKDTMLLEAGDNEMVPYRELHFSIRHEGRDLGIVLQHLLLGRDDIAQGALMIIMGLMLLVALFLIIIINLVAEKIWRPFYRTLDNLTRFKMTEPLPVFPETAIDEFETLNGTLRNLLKKIADDYRHTKEFNENASHELQTHLSVIRANTEKLINRLQSDGNGLDELTKIYSAATRLSQVQRSLLLISKISNREYDNNIDVNLHQVLKLALDTFSEAIDLRGINVEERIADCSVLMDPGLADILVNNLVKNAVKHNIQNGYLTVDLSPASLVVENSGPPFEGDPDSLLQRFAKGANGNIGIGLAIAKQICDLYNFDLSYEVCEKSVHRLTVRFNGR